MTTFTCECAASDCGLKLDVGSNEYKRGHPGRADESVVPLRIRGHTRGEAPTVWLNRKALLALSDALRERGEQLQA